MTFVLRTLLIVLPIAAAAAAGSAESDEMTITRYGTWLLVSAPADHSDPALMVRLREQMTFDFADVSIDEVAAFIRTVSAANVVVMPEISARASAVTLKAKDMELGNLLKWIGTIADVHVGFAHGAIVFSDQEIKAPSRLRLYDIGDLVMPIRDFPGPELGYGGGSGKANAVFAPAADTNTNAPSPDEIVELIKKHVAGVK